MSYQLWFLAMTWHAIDAARSLIIKNEIIVNLVHLSTTKNKDNQTKYKNM